MLVRDQTLYKIETRNGILKLLYARREFTKCEEVFLSIADVPNTEISLRECARLESKFGGQEYQYFHCKKRCQDYECQCIRNKVICNSKCHDSDPCNYKYIFVFLG